MSAPRPANCRIRDLGAQENAQLPRAQRGSGGQDIGNMPLREAAMSTARPEDGFDAQSKPPPPKMLFSRNAVAPLP